MDLIKTLEPEHRSSTRTRAFRHLAGPILATVAAVLVTAAAIVGVMAYGVAANWTHPARIAAEQSPASYGLDFEDLVLTTDDNLRVAAWYIPSTEGATIIVLHGLGGNRAGDLELVRDLVHRGYGVLVPDLRAHGESGGTVSTLGFTEVRDVRAATSYLLQRSDVNPAQIGIYGASLGGAVAIMAAAEIPQLRAVVADSSFASIEWVVQNQFQTIERAPGWLAPVVLGMGSWQMGVDARQVSPVERIARISPRPVLIIHGELDETFVPGNATLLFDAAQEPKELRIDPGVGHTRLYASDPEGYVSQVAGFFDRALR